MADHPVRLPGQRPEEWSEATRAIFDTTVATGRSRPLHLPSVIAHHPTLLGPYIDWAKAVALDATLPPRIVAIAALRSALRTESDFEWGVHADRARASDVLTAAEIGRLGAPEIDDEWSPLERTVLAAVDQLSETATVATSAWNDLARELDDGEMVELVVTVGHYTMLAMIANASGVTGEPDWPALGEAPGF